jgi:DNA-binding MarR family transcriptional regulator/GNAT superfamily N-acetyltransferase
MDAARALRSFSRSYTQRIGVLEESYLGTGRPLGPSRLLFEIPDSGIGVAYLRELLGLDSGYTSRLLRYLEEEGLIEVVPDPSDRRRRLVGLTHRGRREQQRLEERSQRLAASLVEPLPLRLQEDLAASLARADRILRAATVRFSTVDPHSSGASWALEQYFAELDERFETGFDVHDGGAENDALAMVEPRGMFLLMSTDTTTVGCGGVQQIDEHTGELKRMWVDPDWRGLGLGTRLLDRLEQGAVGLGYGRVVLDTNGSLTEAIAMYRAAGYREIERYNTNPYAQHFFEKDLSPD